MASKQAGPSLLQIPLRFSIVEPGVTFLATLGLKTIVSLTAEHPTKPLIHMTRTAGIDFIHLGTILWKPLLDWKPIQDEVVKAALEMLLDTRNHPMLLIDPLGIHQTGCVVGALRMLQRWNFASAMVEYRSHSGPSKHRYSDEQYIEIFDPDLINLPPREYLPAWFDCEDGDGDDTDYEAEEEAVAKRVADGVIPGEGRRRNRY
ncbi:hypothetical protein EHS25_010192 [Saitozyma podzolica]|uniref:Protein-tyrosine-phosphatase n=1 Tax=Saitozyma podzolica TaxID=1890683 RepID=A0A427YIV1_9TREE|nr:hypothetical protein EHS25_010192 [Saitozyma podzolica]